ncbi:hypothetical protein C9374_012115 [Naegleria lovaniensis]|uniref:C2 domain-containing protein n=1 Tax=Naegleria lovaniensis TaxID=51637 RepID=A0AA88GDT8_NAELO|nr:uncharacterized protein C9374_012115 [Naegleria lovaniensis]KAG2373508.1 hypothetical protein C9374_012115 [Naegleria lovaniensis]
MPFAFLDSLSITVKRAADLEAADFNGKSDPYVLVQAKSLSTDAIPSYLKDIAKGWKQKTSVKKKNLNPEWNETKTFYHLDYLDKKNEGIKLLFKVYDWDMLSRDDFIGKAELILHNDKLEHEKVYEETLKLQDVKSGTLYISYKLCRHEQYVLDHEYSYIPLGTNPNLAAQLCVPKDFTMLSSSEVSGSHAAVLANMNTGHVIVVTYCKIGELNWDQVSKNLTEERFREMKKEYSKVEIGEKKDLVPEAHAKNKEITHILEIPLTVEKKGLAMFATMRMVGHSNGVLMIYVYTEPKTGYGSYRKGEDYVKKVSENSTVY